MTSRTHTPEDVQKIMEPWRDSASDYERGFIDGMQKQMQSSVDKAVNRMAQPVIDKSAAVRIATALGWTPQRTWVGLTDEEAFQICVDCGCLSADWLTLLDAIEAKLKEKNT